MRKIVFLLLMIFSLFDIKAQSIETHYKRIGDKGAYEKFWTKFTLSDNGYLIIENGITTKLKIVEMKDPIKEDGMTIYEYTCKENNNRITHKFTVIIPDKLEDNLIMVIDKMIAGTREMPITIYKSKKF